MEIPDKIKNRIIKLAVYTTIKAQGIVKIVSSDIQLTVEDVYKVLDEYQEQNNGKSLRKRKNKEELKEIDDEIIVELYNKGCSNTIIINYLLDNGYVITPRSLKAKISELKKCNEIGKRKIEIKKKKRRKSGITDEEIMDMFEKGITFEAMAKYFNGIGKKITRQRLIMIVHELYAEKGEKAPKRNKKIYREIYKAGSAKNEVEKETEKSIDIKTLDEKKFTNALNNLKTSKNATDEQLRKLAQCYGMDYTGNVNKTSPYVVKDEMER